MSDADSKEQISKDIQKEVEGAIRDVGVLLEFLGKAPDQQLQLQFNGAGGGKSLNISTPSKTYWEFLNRVTTIRASYQQTGEVDGKFLSGNPSLTDRAFLLWAQDFLAALASPGVASCKSSHC